MEIYLKNVGISLAIILAFGACQRSISYLSNQGEYVECEFKGFVPRPTKSYKVYTRFKNNTSAEVLFDLLNSENVALRTYANWALIERLQEGYEPIFEQILKDTSEVVYRCGCTSSSEKVFLTTYLNYLDSQSEKFWSEEGLKERVETDKKLLKLDSIIIFNRPPKSELLGYIFLHREYESPVILDQIVKLAFEAEDPAAGEYLKTHFNNYSFSDHREIVLGLEEDSLSEYSKGLISALKGLEQK